MTGSMQLAPGVYAALIAAETSPAGTATDVVVYKCIEQLG